MNTRAVYRNFWEGGGGGELWTREGKGEGEGGRKGGREKVKGGGKGGREKGKGTKRKRGAPNFISKVSARLRSHL